MLQAAGDAGGGNGKRCLILFELDQGNCSRQLRMNFTLWRLAALTLSIVPLNLSPKMLVACKRGPCNAARVNKPMEDYNGKNH